MYLQPRLTDLAILRHPRKQERCWYASLKVLIVDDFYGIVKSAGTIGQLWAESVTKSGEVLPVELCLQNRSARCRSRVSKSEL